MDTKRPLLPGFLQKLDQRMRSDYPVDWSSRILLTAWYGGLVLCLLFLLGLILPDDPHNDPSLSSITTFIGLISFLAFILWCVYLLRFNVFKRFGNWRNTDTLKTFLYYFFSIALFVSWAVVPGIVQSWKANRKYSIDELIKDANAINTKICLLERDSFELYFERDTLLLDPTVTDEEKMKAYDADSVMYFRDHYLRVNREKLNAYLHLADSSRKLSDSVYIRYQCPDYQFADNYMFREAASAIPYLSSMDLYRQVISSKIPFNRQQTEKELQQLITRYSSSANHSYRYTDRDIYNMSEEISVKYNLYQVNWSFSNIIDRKTRWDAQHISTIFRIVYYISLILSLTLLIYRHNTRRSFFLTLLTGVIVTILTGLIISRSYTEGFILGWLIFYTIFFTAISLTVFRLNHRDTIPGISINSAVLLIPFFPLVCTALYYTLLRQQYRYYNSDMLRNQYYELFKNESLHYMLAEAGGFLLLLVLLATLFRAAWKRWYSLPDQ